MRSAYCANEMTQTFHKAKAEGQDYKAILTNIAVILSDDQVELNWT